MRRRYADLAHGQLHYREAGAGTPLLLFHQTASSSVMYERLAPLLAGRFRVIAVDTPNFGMSDPYPTKPTMGDFARVMVSLLDHLGLDRAVVAGFHTGAHIALELAASHPERVEQAVFVGVLAVRDEAERAEARRQGIRLWAPDWEGTFLESHLELLRTFLDPNDPEALCLELTQRLLAGPDYWHALDALLAQDAIALARGLTVPALFVNPVRDVLIPQTRFLHSVTPGAAYVEIPGGPDVMAAEPQGFADALLAFCAQPC